MENPEYEAYKRMEDLKMQLKTKVGDMSAMSKEELSAALDKAVEGLNAIPSDRMLLVQVKADLLGVPEHKPGAKKKPVRPSSKRITRIERTLPPRDAE